MAAKDSVSGLIGKFNSLSADAPRMGNALLPLDDRRFRKTSAFVTSPTALTTSMPRKTSAMVLMPTKSSLKVKSAYGDEYGVDGGGGGDRLAVSPRTAKKVSLVVTAMTCEEADSTTGTEPSSFRSLPRDWKKPGDEPTEKKGSNLGRSKSLKSQRVKLGPGGNEVMSSKADRKWEAFTKFRQMEQNLPVPTPGHLTRHTSMPSVNAETKPKPIVRSASSAKEIVLAWVQSKVNHYPNVDVTNFSTSWSDGLAFCALIHHFHPEAFDFDRLDATDRRGNFTLAFESAERCSGICPLLDVDDMVRMTRPDWKCVFTYVQSFFRRFRNDGKALNALDPRTAAQLSEKYSEKRIE